MSSANDPPVRVLHLLQAPAAGGGGSVASLAAFLRVREVLTEAEHTPLLLGPTAWAEQAIEAGIGDGFGVSLSPDFAERWTRKALPTPLRRVFFARRRRAGRSPTGPPDTFDRVLAWSTGAAAWWRDRVDGSDCQVLPMDRPLSAWSALGLPPPIIEAPAMMRRTSARGLEALGLKVGLIADPPDGGDARIAAWAGSLLESLGVHTTAVLSHRIGFRAEAIKLHRRLGNTNGLLTPAGVLPSLLSSMDAAIVQPVDELRSGVVTLVGMARAMGVAVVVPPRLRDLLEVAGGDDPSLVAPGETARAFAQTLAKLAEQGMPGPADIGAASEAFVGCVRSLIGAPAPASA